MRRTFERAIFLGIVWVMFVFLWYLLIGYSKYSFLRDVDIDYSSLQFANEVVPFEEPYTSLHTEKIEREIIALRFSYDRIQLYHKREPLYIPYIRERLKVFWLPDDFVYLAIAESALKNNAYSSAWAAGIWQFMPETAKRYGLRVDKVIDERYNFEKATDAALSYLKEMYQDDFHNWTLAAAAYNRWENGLLRDMKEQGVSTYYDLDLNSETARYVWRILAIKYIMEHRYELYDTDLLWHQFTPPETISVEVGAIENIYTWLQTYNVAPSVFRELNPWILGESLPEGKWTVKLPKPQLP